MNIYVDQSLHCFVFFLFKTSTAQEIIGHFEGEQADLVVCDGAPDGKYILVTMLNRSLLKPLQIGSVSGYRVSQ